MGFNSGFKGLNTVLRQPDDDSDESKHVAVISIIDNEWLC